MKNMVIRCAEALLNLIYFFMKRLPVRRKVVMISRQGNEPSVDFRLLQAHLKRKDPDVEVVMLCRTLDGKLQAGALSLIRYGFHMLRQMAHIATSRVVVMDTYCIVVSLLHHREDLEIIQMWHSIGSMKKFGYTALDTDEGVDSSSAHLLHMHENYTVVCAGSPVYAADLAAGFGCSTQIVRTLPLPRMDLLRSRTWMARTRDRIVRTYPHLVQRKVILYCPTFRQEETDFLEAVRRLADAVDPEREVLVMNPHPLSHVQIEGEGILCGTAFSSFELLSAADVMITDYSCIAYEAAFAGVPLYFYDFDMEDYQAERGLAIDYYAEIPGPAEHDPARLMEHIRSGDYDRERLEAFSEKYICYSGHAGADLADLILSDVK